MRRLIGLCPAVCALTLAGAAAPAPGEWIAVKDAPVAGRRALAASRAEDGTSVFTRRVTNAKAVKSARWTATGRGVFELYLNGRRVGDDFLKPGFTDPKKTSYSFSYDVTGLLRRGAGEANDFGAESSAGWWRDMIVDYAGKKSLFRCAIDLTYADGSVERIVTKATEWKGSVAGPVRHAAIFDGEEYDARETNAARTPPKDFAPGGCERSDEFAGEVLPSNGAEVCLRRDLALHPVGAAGKGPFKVPPGASVVLDFGQNCAAVPSFRFRAKRGTVLTVLPAEMLNDADKGQRGSDGPKGSVYRANLRMPANGMRLVYTFAGDGWEEYLPRFTFFGYRYLSLAATDGVEIERVESVPVSSVTQALETGRLETGDRDVNRLIANVYWGMLSNYLSVPTDCPQRNERVGWTADTQVFAEAGSFVADTDAFLRKWMRDMRDSQLPKGGYRCVAPHAMCGVESMRFGWSDAGVIVPYQMWKQFGDVKIIDENWESMVRYVARVNETRYTHAATAEETRAYQCADWLSYEKLESCSDAAFEKVNGQDVVRREAEVYWNYLGGCYWLWDAQQMEAMAKATGRDAAPYGKMVAEARAYLRKNFFDPRDGCILRDYRDMQTPALFALKFGLVEGAAKEKTIAGLKANFAAHGGCLQTGFLGTSILMDTLTENAMADLAYSLLLQHKCPSWLYSVDQGATTVWERWNSYTKESGFGPVFMNSFNHYAYGAVLAWIYKTVAGIAADPSAPGFRNIVMAPIPDRRLGSVKAEFRSRAGLVRSAWRYEGEKWIWDFTVPAGATASVTLPGEKTAHTYRAGDHHVEK